MEENKGCPNECLFEKNKAAFEESIMKRVNHILRLEYDSLFYQFDDYKIEQAKAIEDFRRSQEFPYHYGSHATYTIYNLR